MEKLIKETADRLCADKKSAEEKLESIFYFVRDDIKFGFPANGDLVAGSEVIETGIGQCNNKSSLFHSLCRAAGIKSRVHFSLIKKEIQAGLFTGLFFKLMPDKLSHSWVEVEIDGRWVRIDSFINDISFYNAAVQKLKKENRKTGYSVSFESGVSSPDFNIIGEKFVQMDAVTDDHGTWENPADYYKSKLYQNRPGTFKQKLYRMHIGKINKKIRLMREEAKT